MLSICLSTVTVDNFDYVAESITKQGINTIRSKVTEGGAQVTELCWHKLATKIVWYCQRKHTNWVKCGKDDFWLVSTSEGNTFLPIKYKNCDYTRHTTFSRFLWSYVIIGWGRANYIQAIYALINIAAGYLNQQKTPSLHSSTELWFVFTIDQVHVTRLTHS